MAMYGSLLDRGAYDVVRGPSKRVRSAQAPSTQDTQPTSTAQPRSPTSQANTMTASQWANTFKNVGSTVMDKAEAERRQAGFTDPAAIYETYQPGNVPSPSTGRMASSIRTTIPQGWNAKFSSANYPREIPPVGEGSDVDVWRITNFGGWSPNMNPTNSPTGRSYQPFQSTVPAGAPTIMSQYGFGYNTAPSFRWNKAFEQRYTGG